MGQGPGSDDGRLSVAAFAFQLRYVFQKRATIFTTMTLLGDKKGI